jgi:AcrR family transcriptional regulator
MGWKAVRAVAQRLHYTSPLLYEHFQDKQEILTELAIESQAVLAREMLRDLPADPFRALLSMVERYWTFMLQNKQLYRLMNGMDGVVIDRNKVTKVAQHSFEAATAIVRTWLTTECRSSAGVEHLFEDLWALLHAMAALYLDRSTPFDVERAKDCVSKLLIGTREQAKRARS